MSTDNYLNSSSLLYFWQGVKTKISNSFNTLGTAAYKSYASNIPTAGGNNLPTQSAVVNYISTREVTIPIDPEETPTTPGAIWIETS